MLGSLAGHGRDGVAAGEGVERDVVVPVAIVVGVLALLTFFIPEKKSPTSGRGSHPPEPEEAEFDAFAGGYPVPPMPGQHDSDADAKEVRS